MRKPQSRRVLARRRKQLLALTAMADLCFYCREPMAENSQDPPTLEHLVSISRGGNNRPPNLRLAHRRCNETVGDLPRSIKLRLAGQMPRARLPDWVRAELAADPSFVWPIWLGKRPVAAEIEGSERNEHAL